MPFVCRLETGRKFALFNNITSCMLHAVFVQTALPRGRPVGLDLEILVGEKRPFSAHSHECSSKGRWRPHWWLCVRSNERVEPGRPQVSRAERQLHGLPGTQPIPAGSLNVVQG
jgi:hypothetical protein